MSSLKDDARNNYSEDQTVADVLLSQRTGDLPPVISSCCSDYTNSGWLFHPLWGAQQLVWLECEVLVGLLENFFLASWLTATSFCLSYWLFWSEICLSPVCKEVEKGASHKRNFYEWNFKGVQKPGIFRNQPCYSFEYRFERCWSTHFLRPVGPVTMSGFPAQ